MYQFIDSCSQYVMRMLTVCTPPGISRVEFSPVISQSKVIVKQTKESAYALFENKCYLQAHVVFSTLLAQSGSLKKQATILYNMASCALKWFDFEKARTHAGQCIKLRERLFADAERPCKQLNSAVAKLEDIKAKEAEYLASLPGTGI